MAIAFSGTEIIYRNDLDGSSTTMLLADLDSALTAAGWTSDPITGGRVYRALSPQELACRVRIWDPADYSFGIVYIFVQFTSEDGLRLGYRHMLACTAGKIFQIVVNRCQMFVSVAGHSDGFTNGNCVAGGVPFSYEAIAATGECGAERVGPLLDEIWWSSGDRQDGPDAGVRLNFRNGYRTFQTWCACYRGDLVTTDTGPGRNYGNLLLFPVTQCYNVDSDIGNPPEIRWYGGGPLYLDPILGWGSGADSSMAARARAQIYDSLIVSVDRPLDDLATIDGRPYINYAHSSVTAHGLGTHFASLHLLTVQPTPSPGIGNYVY